MFDSPAQKGLGIIDSCCSGLPWLHVYLLLPIHLSPIHQLSLWYFMKLFCYSKPNTCGIPDQHLQVLHLPSFLTEWKK
jgi:hypothetical protein